MLYEVITNGIIRGTLAVIVAETEKIPHGMVLQGAYETKVHVGEFFGRIGVNMRQSVGQCERGEEPGRCFHAKHRQEADLQAGGKSLGIVEQWPRIIDDRT